MHYRGNSYKKLLIYLFFILLLTSCSNNDTHEVAMNEKEKTNNRLDVTTTESKPVSDITVSPIDRDSKTINGTVSLSVDPIVDKRITKVEFYSSNGEYLIGTKTSEPYTVNWATDPWVPDGKHIIKVKIFDRSNHSVEVKKTVLVNNSSKSDTAEDAFRLIGYYAGWATYSNYEVTDIDAKKLTHINYAFANISEDGRLIVGDPWADLEKPFPGDNETQELKGNFNQLIKLKKQNPHLKTLISVGGWTWSDKFSDAALTEESRAVFADSVRTFILKYGFDGVDLDWEYPVSGGKAGNANRPEDKQNYTLLLKKIRETLDAQSKKDGRRYLLTIAAGASKSHAGNMELNEIHQYVDYIQLMTYDIKGEWDSLTGLNAPLHQESNNNGVPGWSIKDAVYTYKENGVPVKKLVMGLPFYGRVFNEVENNGNGLNQFFSAGGTSISYTKVESSYLDNDGYTRYWEEKSKVPWLFNGSTFISYDDVESIGYKTDFIQSMDLGGAMMWELSQDPDKVLLTKIYNDLKK